MGQANLPLASGRRHAKAFANLGWEEVRSHTNNPHIIMMKAGSRVTLSIPNHPEVKRALLQGLLRAAGVSEADYLRAFK